MRRRTFFRRPRFAFPIDQARRRRSAHAFPPWLASSADGNVGKNGVVAQSGHDVGIGFLIGAGRDAEKSVLGIDGTKSAVLGDMHPGDVVANGPNAIPLVF